MKRSDAAPSANGFTLIELVVVLTIISVLAGIAIQNFTKVRDKAEAARVATQLHYIEDAIVEAILDGATASDIVVRSGDPTGTALEDYLTSANFADVPEGMGFDVLSTPVGESFWVHVGIQSDQSHEDILDELHAMFPRTSTVTPNGREMWLSVDASTLAPVPVTTPSGGD